MVWRTLPYKINYLLQKKGFWIIFELSLNYPAMRRKCQGLSKRNLTDKCTYNIHMTQSLGAWGILILCTILSQPQLTWLRRQPAGWRPAQRQTEEVSSDPGHPLFQQAQQLDGFLIDSGCHLSATTLKRPQLIQPLLLTLQQLQQQPKTALIWCIISTSSNSLGAGLIIINSHKIFEFFRSYR